MTFGVGNSKGGAITGGAPVSRPGRFAPPPPAPLRGVAQVAQVAQKSAFKRSVARHVAPRSRHPSQKQRIVGLGFGLPRSRDDIIAFLAVLVLAFLFHRDFVLEPRSQYFLETGDVLWITTARRVMSPLSTGHVRSSWIPTLTRARWRTGGCRT